MLVERERNGGRQSDGGDGVMEGIVERVSVCRITVFFTF